MAHIIADKYEVIDQIGRGGMGIVYKVRHLTLGTVLALKMLPTDLVNDPEMVRRFHQEARLMAQLHHPNIVRVLDVDKEGELPYFVMEYIAGKSLSQHLREHGPLLMVEVLTISRQLALALAYAHTYQPPVIHRDIKPDNILLEDQSGRVVVTDFGIAKVLGAGTQTSSDLIPGTLLYCAPEQILQGEALDGRADLYSLGLVMYEMVEGQPFFSGLDARALLGQVLYGPEENIPIFTRPVSPSFTALVTRAITRDREQRHQQATELLRDIDSCLTEWPTPAPSQQTTKSTFIPLTPTSPSSSQEVTLEVIHSSTELQLLLESNIIQINSPYRIPAELLQPFLAQEKRILCILPDKQVMPSVVLLVERNSLLASIDEREAMKLLQWQEGLVVIIFSVSPRQTYVLQTRLQKIYAGQVRLLYQDPRFDQRFKAAQLVPITVQILPPEAVTQWHEKNLEIVRQTTWELESCGTRQIGCLEDGIYSPEDKKLRKITDYVEVADPLAAALKDISLGGAGIILAHEFQEEQWKEKIVLVNFRLPQSEATPAETYSEIEVLATVRGINTVPPYTLLHLRFLQQLPNSLALSHITQKDKTTHNLSWYFMRKEQSDTKFL